MQLKNKNPRRRLIFGCVALAAVTMLPGCLIWSSTNFAVGTESYRANLVIHAKTTEGLGAWRASLGEKATRDAILAGVPDKIQIRSIWTFVCDVAMPICTLGLDKATATVRAWFISDIKNRTDFGAALTSAVRGDDCFAWTFIPSRNLTTKPPRNSGCRSDR